MKTQSLTKIKQNSKLMSSYALSPRSNITPPLCYDSGGQIQCRSQRWTDAVPHLKSRLSLLLNSVIYCIRLYNLVLTMNMIMKWEISFFFLGGFSTLLIITHCSTSVKLQANIRSNRSCLKSSKLCSHRLKFFKKLGVAFS